MNQINYARAYSDMLAQAFPYELRFGDLYGTPNNGRYRFSGGKKIELPVITTTGRTDGNRDALPVMARNYENSWETKTLSNHRCWSTLIHPADIDQTAGAVNVENVTRVYNREHKFPEMDAYCVSKLYSDFTDADGEPVRETLTASNVLETFDGLMQEMTENLVPVSGRILYVTPAVMSLIKAAAGENRVVSGTSVDRSVTTLDGVKVVAVPSAYMMTEYDFTSGVSASEDAEQIQMLLVHPDAVITPVSYEFACLDEPTAATGGKYVYYEESFEDVFVLENRASGLAFVLPEE